jgi:2-C-methyl-D-erythritol 4-phosphate cytidylyltransferase
MEILLKAYQRAMEDDFAATDDASLVERLGVKVKIVEGSYDNIKITTREDLELAELILRRQLSPAA